MVELETTVKNRAISLGNTTGSVGPLRIELAQWVESKLAGLNYWVETENCLQHEVPILNRISIHSVFFAATHGSLLSFCDCDGEQGMDETHFLEAYGPTLEIQNAVDSKSNSQPPYVSVFIDGCSTAECNPPFCRVLAKAFRVVDPATGGNLPGKAFLGWEPCFTRNAEHNNWVKALWNELAGCETLAIARLEANAQYSPGATAIIHGDPAFKLRGAYGKPSGDCNWTCN